MGSGKELSCWRDTRIFVFTQWLVTFLEMLIWCHYFSTSGNTKLNPRSTFWILIQTLAQELDKRPEHIKEALTQEVSPRKQNTVALCAIHVCLWAMVHCYVVQVFWDWRARPQKLLFGSGVTSCSEHQTKNFPWDQLQREGELIITFYMYVIKWSLSSWCCSKKKKPTYLLLGHFPKSYFVVGHH